MFQRFTCPDDSTSFLPIDAEKDEFAINKRLKTNTTSSDDAEMSDIARANKAAHDSFGKSSIIEATPDNQDKHIFPNFKVACEYYHYPGTHQRGSVGNADGIVRTYSNSTPGKDKILNMGAEVWYRLKSLDMQAQFQRNIDSGQPVRFFRRVPWRIGKQTQKPGCKDMGLFDVIGFVENDAFVRLVQRPLTPDGS